MYTFTPLNPERYEFSWGMCRSLPAYHTFCFTFMKKSAFLTISLLCCSFFALGWGFYAHKVIHQLAIYALPKQMQPFYYRHQQTLVETSVLPDQRRNQDSLEAPRHFIDVDIYGESAAYTLPESWDEAVKLYPADTLRKYGIVPWHVVTLKDRLTEAFRARNPDSILFYSADLGHYIADAHVPLHTTLNYDGQFTGQKGLHSLWESKLPEMFLTDYRLHTRKAAYLSDPQHAIWEVVRASFRLVDQTLTQEQEASQGFTAEQKYDQAERNGQTRQYYSGAFATAYQKQLGTTVEQRLRASAQTVASFWYTCWVDGGKPNITKLLPTPLAKAEKRAFRKERKAWRKNELVADSLLLAKPNR